MNHLARLNERLKGWRTVIGGVLLVTLPDILTNLAGVDLSSFLSPEWARPVGLVLLVGRIVLVPILMQFRRAPGPDGGQG